MTDTSLDDLGPVDYLVVEFPAGASNFTGEMAAELLALVDSGTIRVIDILILTKDEDGAVEAMELADVGELGELQALEAQLAELLAEDDVEHLAAAMEPGSTAGVLIWENLWAAPFASAARRSGGQLIANGRIPIQAIIASIEADERTDERRRLRMPLRPARVGRVGVIGAPVAGEDRGRGQGRHTRPRAGRENRSRGRGRHTRTAGSPPPNLVPDWSSGDADTRRRPGCRQSAASPDVAVRGRQPAPGNAMSRRAGATGRSDSNRPHRSVHTPGPMALVWITVARGVMAIVLGLALALHRDRAPAALVNFMGVYWILNGIVTFQWGLAAEGPRRRLPLAAGAIGTVTGAVVLVANVGTTFLLAILGVVIALTGIAHLLGGFELADRSGRRWRPGVPLGILEIGLGTTLILTADRHDSLSTWLASAWALLGGAVLVSDALLMRRRLLAHPDDR